MPANVRNGLCEDEADTLKPRLKPIIEQEVIYAKRITDDEVE